MASMNVVIALFVTAVFLPGAAAVSAKIESNTKNSMAATASATEERTIAHTPRTRRSNIVVGTPLVHQHLTICSAYRRPLSIIHVDQKTNLTKDDPLKYKECREFVLPLMEGDHLDFKSNGLDVGTFHSTVMPKASASLLLVPRHRHGSSRTITFESHVFADVKNPQIAVVDAYSGKDAAAVNIAENEADLQPGKTPMQETLRYNSVVAVTPGRYNINLLGVGASTNVTAVPLRASLRAKCVIMRVGGGDRAGLAFPQELVVFYKSGAGRLASVLLATLLCLSSVHQWVL